MTKSASRARALFRSCLFLAAFLVVAYSAVEILDRDMAAVPTSPHVKCRKDKKTADVLGGFLITSFLSWLPV